jgi:hypothetical protein
LRAVDRRHRHADPVPRFWDPVEERRKRDEAMAAEDDDLQGTPPATPSQEPQPLAA